MSRDVLLLAMHLFLLANIVTTSKAPVTTSVALVTTSFLLLLALKKTQIRLFSPLQAASNRDAWGRKTHTEPPCQLRIPVQVPVVAVAVNMQERNSSNKCIATRNKCLTSTNKKLLETSALPIVTIRF